MGTWEERFDFYESKITKPEYNPRTESDIPHITSAPMDLMVNLIWSQENLNTLWRNVLLLSDIALRQQFHINIFLIFDALANFFFLNVT